MARVFLISANTTEEPLAVYPLGMALVAAALEGQGHGVRQFDRLYDREAGGCEDNNCGGNRLSQALENFNPDIVGISVRNIDNVDSLSVADNWYLSRIKGLVAEIRSCCGAPVVLGGPAVSIMPEAILEYTGADHCVVGEGEAAFDLLIREILEGKNPPRITGPLKERIRTEEFVSPCYEAGLVEFYMDRSGMANYQTKRGCPFGCNYCSYPVIEGRQFRYQDPSFVVENLARLRRDFGVDSIFFTDSVFNDPSGHYLEVAEAMARADLGVRWAAYFRPDEIASQDLALLKRSGLYAMEVGSDAACDATLTGIGKSFGFDRVMAFNEACREAEIPCAHFFMFGGPGETPETVGEGLANIEGLRHTVVSAFSGIRILPGTGLAKIAADQGMIPEDDDLLLPRFYISPEVDKEDMDTSIEASFGRRKDRFFPPEKGIIRLKALKAFGFKGLLWDMVLQMPEGRRRMSR